MLQQTRPHFSLSLCHVIGLEEPADYTAFDETLNLLFHRPLSTSTHTLVPAVPLNTLTWRNPPPFPLDTQRRPTNAEGNAVGLCASTWHPNQSPMMDGNLSSLQLCISVSWGPNICREGAVVKLHCSTSVNKPWHKLSFPTEDCWGRVCVITSHVVVYDLVITDYISSIMNYCDETKKEYVEYHEIVK